MQHNSIAELLREEFAEEVKSTRQVLERIPEEKLTWGPHPKSMTLGQLAFHVTLLPGGLSDFYSETEREIPDVPLSSPKNLSALFAAFEDSTTKTEQKLSAWDDSDLMTECRIKQGEQTIMSAPRYMMLRSTLFNHWYHHRGQLTVYLRLLDVPVPGVYGPSADEN